MRPASISAQRRLAGFAALLATIATGAAPDRIRRIGEQHAARPVSLDLAMRVRARYVALRESGRTRGFVVDAISREFDLSTATVVYLCRGCEPPRPALVVHPRHVVVAEGRAA